MPINVDVAIGPAHYKGFRESQHVLVTSMFRTLQGEAPFTGHPAVFLRTAGCNYGKKNPYCNFCDTAFQFAMGKKLHFSELSEQLAALYKPGDILVITGGEPTLQHALIDWIQYDSTPWEEVQFETNGTQFKFFQELDKSCLADHPVFVVSPKANTRTKVYPTVHEDVLRYARCLKFVLEPDPESPHHTIPEWAFDSGIPIYVSPAAYYLRTPTSEVASAWDHTLINAEATARSYAYAAQYAMDHGLLLSIQTHLFAAVP